MAATTQKPNRPRSSSVLDYLKDPGKEHRLGEFSGGQISPVERVPGPPEQQLNPPAPTIAKPDEIPHFEQGSEGLFKDLITMRWMRVPASSFKMILIVLAVWAGFHYLRPGQENPVDALIRISYPLPKILGKRVFYDYGWRDLAFLAFYVVVFSFIRQATTEYLLRPLARFGGIRGPSKQQRFMEQSYSILYFSTSGLMGLHVMRGLPTWWYKTEHFWIDYPHQMTPEIKTYYLLQLAYWIQQLLILVLKIEKPRPDYVELCIHHLVTLWLVSWSYSAYLTRIGNTIFVSMDLSDVFLALAKCLNYVKLQRTSEVVFGSFVFIWAYFRHYLNLKMMWSVLTQYDTLTPPHARFFAPGKGVWLAPWFKYQVFTPIMLLQLVNIFWFYLILRIVFRILMNQGGKDTREEEEEQADLREEQEAARKEAARKQLAAAKKSKKKQ